MTARGIDFTGIAYLALIGAVGFIGYQLYVNRQAIATALNPADQGNLVNRATNSFVTAATGGAEQGGESSLGGLLARMSEKGIPLTPWGWLTRPFTKSTDEQIEDLKRGNQTGSWESRLRAQGVSPINVNAGLQL